MSISEISVAFSSTESRVALSTDVVAIADKCSVGNERCVEKDLETVYSGMATASWINDNDFKRVALQFPDDLFNCSVAVTKALRQLTAATIVILADTNFGNCCIDEIAAEHYGVDALVHYGHACLSPVRRLPVFYVFGKCSIDVESCSNLVQSALASDGAAADKDVVLIYDVVYDHAIASVAERLRAVVPNLIVPSLVLPSTTLRQTPDQCNNQSQSTTSCETKTNDDLSTHNNRLSGDFVHFNRRFSLPPGRTIADCSLVYIGAADSALLRGLIMTFNQCSRVISYDPQTNQIQANVWNANRMLMRRYYMVEKARDAARVGILVGTLGVEDYLTVIRQLSDVIRRAGKKCYRFVVGKLNVAKLANFAEIDVFVLVACPENTLIDSSEMFRPVITPYEMELACLPGKQWTGNYELDFRQLLPGGTSYFNCIAETAQSGEMVDVSLITGKMRRVGLDDEQQGTVLRANSGELVQQDGRLVVHNSAGEFLIGRSWQGLDPRLGETPVEKAAEGQTGIAMGYSNERKTTCEPGPSELNCHPESQVT